MMAIIRRERKDYGGVEAWDDRDPDAPVYVHSATSEDAVTQSLVDAVIDARIAAREELELVEE